MSPSHPHTENRPGSDDEGNVISRQLKQSVEALAAGDLSAWEPLPLAARWSHLSKILPEPSSPVAGTLLGQPATFVSWPATGHLPTGATIWMQHDTVVLIDARDPQIESAALEALGPPIQKMSSGLGSSYSQWLYPTRGLIVHASYDGSRIKRLFGLEALSTNAMKAAPIISISEQRIRRS